jgi:hypothetical protein
MGAMTSLALTPEEVSDLASETGCECERAMRVASPTCLLQSARSKLRFSTSGSASSTERSGAW